MSENQKENVSQADSMDQKKSSFDPFARDNHSESEIQAQEKQAVEARPDSRPGTPGSPVRPGSERMQGSSLDNNPDRPEAPGQPAPPEINPLHNPESQPLRQPEVAPARPAPEIQVPDQPVRHTDPHDYVADEVHNKGHIASAWQEQDDDGELKRVFPSIQNHDNLEGRSDTAGENWDGENLDLDIDSDSNREE